ncbi:endoglucanase E-4-like [Glandiceps talaboti]
MNLCYILLFALLSIVTVIQSQNYDGLYEIPQPRIPDEEDDGEEDSDSEEEDDDEKRSVDETISGRVKRQPGYDYCEALHKSILFYEAQQSGELPDWNRIKWRGNSALGDKGDKGESLTGGLYDAGDHVKFNFPMAYTATVLGWGLVEFRDAYDYCGETEHMELNLRWLYDYFMKCHPEPHVYYYQVGNAGADHQYWGRPENMTMDRPAYKCDDNVPCSEAAAEASAALSTCAIIFKDSDPEYANKCLQHSKELLEFATTVKGVYPDQSYYPSAWFLDEICWANLWLFRVEGTPDYLNICEVLFADKYNKLKSRAYAFGWGDKKAGLQMLLYAITKDDIYKKKVNSFISNWLPGMKLPYTPRGLVMRNSWGSLRYAAGTSALAALAYHYGMDPDHKYYNWAVGQIDYSLGDGGHSFMVGFGYNPPTKPHHRSSSCPKDLNVECKGSNSFKSIEANPSELTGAMVGGPDGSDWWNDDRSDYIHNEVACDYNAGLQTALAGLISISRR